MARDSDASTADFLVQALVKQAAKDAGLELVRFVRWEVFDDGNPRIVIRLTKYATFRAPLDMSQGLSEAVRGIQQALAAYMFAAKDHISDDHHRW